MAEQTQNRMEGNRQNRLTCPVQDYTNISCPNCGSRRLSTTRTEKKTESTRERIHYCKNCPAKFKSIETIPSVDREDLQKDPDSETPQK